MQQDPMRAARSSVNKTHGADGHIWHACEPMWSKKQRTIRPRWIKNMSTLLWMISYSSQFLLCFSQLWIHDNYFKHLHVDYDLSVLHGSNANENLRPLLKLKLDFHHSDLHIWLLMLDSRPRWLPASFLHHWDVLRHLLVIYSSAEANLSQQNPFVLHFWQSVRLPWWINGSGCVFRTCVS